MLALNIMIKNFKSKLNNFITGMVGTTNSATRDQWIISTLNSFDGGLKILDAGAGESKYKKYCTHLDYTSQDFAEYDGEGDNKGIQKHTRDYSELDIISDICDIPVEDSTYDIVLCSEVLEHIPDPSKALIELDRVLKPNGIILLTAPFASLTHYSPYHYATGFNIHFYNFHLEKLGFEILESTPNGNYFEFLAQEIRRIEFAGKEFSDKKIRFVGKISIYVILYYLNKFSKNDKNSFELLNYGYHIKALKK